VGRKIQVGKGDTTKGKPGVNWGGEQKRKNPPVSPERQGRDWNPDGPSSAHRRQKTELGYLPHGKREGGNKRNYQKKWRVANGKKMKEASSAGGPGGKVTNLPESLEKVRGEAFSNLDLKTTISP